ncbi:hypothetical protein EV363DRAFT_1585927 [Boletus edulis]|nr:hypothetical protein EV363DRAFT_1585927 [Boletus edulis]
MRLSPDLISSMSSSESTDYQPEELIPEQKASIPCLAFWPDGSRLIAVVGSGLQIWNVKEKTREGEVIRGGFFTKFTTVSVSTDGKKFATGGTYRDGGQVLLWDTNSRRIEHTFDKPAMSRCLCVVHSSSDTRLLAYAVEREYMSDSLEVRNVADGSCVCVLELWKGNTRCTRFSPDDTRLAACWRLHSNMGFGYHPTIARDQAPSAFIGVDQRRITRYRQQSRLWTTHDVRRSHWGASTELARSRTWHHRATLVAIHLHVGLS